MARSLKSGKPAVVNAYSRAVSDDGNPRARYLMRTVFSESASLWRGLGKIEKSGLKIKEEFADFDAENKFYIDWDSGVDIAGCKCGEVLKGTMTPDKCPLFGKRCVPANPVGPCMVSSEGSCAAYYKYGER